MIREGLTEGDIWTKTWLRVGEQVSGDYLQRKGKFQVPEVRASVCGPSREGHGNGLRERVAGCLEMEAEKQ